LPPAGPQPGGAAPPLPPGQRGWPAHRDRRRRHRPRRAAMTGADMSDGEPRHSELMAQARRHLIRYLGGEFPDILIERAAGSYVYDDPGRRILDFTSGQMCSTPGHHPPAVVDGIRRSSGRAFHLFSGLLSPEVVELGRQLTALLPPSLTKVIFLNTGSESTEVAIRMAKLATGRWEVAALTGSFHG